ncbi:MAG: pyridoxamine 5'-phosphate oxidase family protein [Phycisphaeraceae bacterium]
MPMTTAPEQLRRLLEQATTLSLATVDAADQPHAANVNFVGDEQLNLYWLSSPDSAHSQHLAGHPRVAATAYPPFADPAEIRGVQLHGHAVLVSADRFELLWTRFCEKFPYATGMEERARSQRFYQLTPHWARLIDNSVRFGFKQEWQLRSTPPPPSREST